MYKPSRKRWTLAVTLLSLGLGAAGCWASQPPPILQNVRTAALSGNGVVLAVAQGVANNDVALIDTKTGHTKRVLIGCGGTLETLLFSPDDKTLVTYATVCSGDTYYWEAKLWDVRMGKLRHTMEAPDIGPLKSGSYALGFTADWQLAGMTDGDAFVRLWTTATGKRTGLAYRSQFFFSSDGIAVPTTSALTSIVAQFPLATPLEFCTFSSDKHLLLTLSGKNTVSGRISADDGPGKAAVLWDAKTGKQLRILPLEGHSAYSASLQGDKAFISGEDSALVWDLARGTTQSLWQAPFSADKFDWFWHSHIVWARLTRSGQKAALIALHLKPVVQKNPHEVSSYWYAGEATFDQYSTATGQRTGTFGLMSW